MQQEGYPKIGLWDAGKRIKWITGESDVAEAQDSITQSRRLTIEALEHEVNPQATNNMGIQE